MEGSHTHTFTHTHSGSALHACSLETDQTADFISNNLNFLFHCFICFLCFQSRLGEVNLNRFQSGSSEYRDQKQPQTQRDPDPRLQLLLFLSVVCETFSLRGETAGDMPGFVALLAAFAVLSVGLRSSAAAVEMQSSVEESPSVPAVQRTAAAGVNSSAVASVESSREGDRGAARAGCPGRCRCEVDGLLHRVDCSDLGLREIPSNLSVFTSYL